MSKVKFSKEWFVNNKVAINCETEDEVIKLFEEFIKIEITRWYGGRDITVNEDTRFEIFRINTCYSNKNSRITYDSIGNFQSLNYTVIKFSDLEFESEINLNTYEEMGYKDMEKKLEPVKRTILRDDVVLKNGDIVAKEDLIGLVVGDCVSWNNSGWESISDNLYTNLKWIITSESLKTDKGYEISKLLFKGLIVKTLEDLIIHVKDKPKEPIKKTVEVFSVKFCKTKSGISHYISDSEEIFVEDIVSPIRGEYEDLYGEVINIQIKELSEEELESYDKIIKIK